MSEIQRRRFIITKLKALILAGGRGSRVNEISEERNKCMEKQRGQVLKLDKI